jgi:subtilisin-like proprotein convertase family protein
VKGLRIFASRLGLFTIVSLLIAALSSAVLADAEPPPPSPPGEHLLLVPQTADGVVALAGADARVVANYESFSLVEAEGEDYRRLRAAGADRRDDMREVTTAAGAIDPATDRASLAGKQAPDRDEALALVQFIGPPKDAWVERLRSTGARIVTYQAENAYVVHASGDAVERVAALVGTDPAVRAVIPVTAADKLEGEADGPARYAVSTISGSAGADVRDQAAAAGPAVGAAATAGTMRTQYLELSPAEVAELARDPGVVAIERYSLPKPADERAAQVVAGNLLPPAFTQPSGPGYLAWHNARFPGTATFPFAVDVTDTGLDNGADPPAPADFRALGSSSNPDRVAYQTDYTSPPPGGTDLDTDPPRDCTGHGTNVASIAAGYNDGAGAENQDGAGYRHGLGVAPRVQIGNSKVFQSCSAYDRPDDADTLPDHAFAPNVSMGTITSNAYAAGARISNNSWGSGGGAAWGDYSSLSRQYDVLVRDAQSGMAGNQQMVEVFSAGNDGEAGGGSVNAEGTAKNVITVGASESVRPSGVDGCGTPDSSADNAREVADFSSRGPTDDGRLKPDLVAPGTHVTGARPLHGGYDGSGTCNPVFAGTAGYSLVSGSSQAAPQVSGAAALVRDWYQTTHLAEASPALTKALLVNTASDIASGPNDDQGWGRANLGTAFDSTAREFYDQRPADVLDTVGQTVVRAFTVPDTSKPVKVTLVWTDAPGALTGNAFVNNLDLEVGAGGERYRGNVFGGSYSRTGGAADTRNNVESVYLPPGTSGRVSVTVRATGLGGDGLPGSGDGTDQDFALVVSNASEQAAPVLLHEATALTGGDGDGVLESDEQAALTEQVRNAGNTDATGLSATLNGGPGLAVTQGSSGYPDILADDGMGTNSTSFGVHLANAATCGADVPATLSITSSSETQTVPLVLPTGAAGAPQTTSAASPVAIPDNSAAGVSSSVFVPERGRIKDLNVTVDIVHSWVGDLVIELIGPDGTTVRLADHPGGPDNSGDNFAGTTFDDDLGPNISAGAAPYTGPFRPQNDQLSRFDGKSRRGTWTLRVRDLFAGDAGTLGGWGVTSQKAVCDIDTTAPDTSIASGPANPTTSTSAQFSLGSDDGGATFECSLDGAAYEPCGAAPTFAGLALGTHTLSARAIDGSDNEDATPPSYSWTIDPVPPTPTPATSFVLAPVEEDLANALAGRYTVVAACASACRTSATISVPPRTARRLDLSRKAYALGSGATRRGSAGTAKLSVRLSRRVRLALRGHKLIEATVRVTVTEGARKLTFKRAISLRRGAGLERIASRGLRLWAACARRCPLSAELTLSAAQARRLGLKPGRASRYQVASGRTTGTTTPRVLTLKVRRNARRPLARARKVGTLLEAVAGQAPEPLRILKLSKTLRR